MSGYMIVDGQGNRVSVPSERVRGTFRCAGRRWVIHDSHLASGEWSPHILAVTDTATGHALPYNWGGAEADAEAAARSWILRHKASLLRQLGDLEATRH